VTSAGTAMAEFAVGATVDPRDPVALAEALDALLADDEGRRCRGARAAEVAAQMTWQRAAERTVAAYREVL
jgi:glycosyltransferase involved in cell wall biosynthesis